MQGIWYFQGLYNNLLTGRKRIRSNQYEELKLQLNLKLPDKVGIFNPKQRDNVLLLLSLHLLLCQI